MKCSAILYMLNKTLKGLESMIDLLNQIQTYTQEYSSVTIIAVLILLGFIEIVPIKVNPLSAIGHGISKLLKWISKQIMGEFVDKLDNITNKVDTLSTVVDENEIDRIRWEIFMFSSECQRGINHTQREFQRIFKINRKYHDILERIHEENGDIDREIAYLEKLYAEKQEHDSFLK